MSTPAPAIAQINGGNGANAGGGGGGFGGSTGGGGAGGGGAGGNGTGGNGGAFGGGGAGVGGGGGGGGNPGSGTIPSFTNSGAISGGNGGIGGGGGAGIGGGGGVALINDGPGGDAGFTIGDNTITNTSTGTITGGNGGATFLGIGGETGGAGIGRGGKGIFGLNASFGLDGITIINAGAITGGNGLTGAGGDGINGSSLTVINSGSITGGLAGDGVTRANAITFFGGANTFEVRAGSVITGLVVDQTNNGTFRLGGATDSTFDISSLGLAYLGFTSFAKTGASNWTLTGTSTYAGPVNVNGGTLSVDGNIASAAGVMVNSGGTLGGTGTVPTTVIAAGGTLGPGNSIGAINVQGNLTFNAGSTYKVEVDGTTADKTNVTGTANLGGTLLVVPATRTTTRTTYTIISAAAYTGAFAAMTVRNPFARFISSSINGNDFEIVLDQATVLVPPGASQNNTNVANAINSAILAGANPPAGFGTLLGLSGDQLTAALNQLSGQGGNGATQQTAYASTSQFIGTILDPSIDGRGGGAGGGGVTGYAEKESDALAYAGKRASSGREAFANMPLKARPVRDSFGARGSVWASGYGGSASVEGNAATGTHSTSSSIYGTAVGADYRIGRDTIFGFAMGGGGTNFSTAQGLGKGRADLFQAGLYARQNLGLAYVAGALAYGWQDVTVDRTVTVAGTDQLRAKFDAQTFAARIEAGYRIATTLMGVTPYGALQATRVRLPGYSEFAVSGSSQFALSFNAQTTNNVRSELGLRGDKSFAGNQDSTLTLRSRVAWAHDSNTNRVVSPTFQSLPGASFIVSGARPAADSALVSAGPEMKWRNGWSVAGLFEGEFSRTTESYAGKGTVRYAW